MFEKKKIKIETLGEYLLEVRESLKLSLREVSKKTQIKFQYLQGFETGDFGVLPPKVYALGFLRKLGVLYKIDSEILIGQFEKELKIMEKIKAEKEKRDFLKNKIGKVAITPKLLSLVLGFVFFIISVVYIIWQVVAINQTPSLEVFEPKDQQAIADSSVVVSGKTAPNMKVSVNSENVYVDKDGNFKTTVGISSGPKELVITSKNKFDKSVTKILTIIGQQQAQNIQGKLEMSLNFTAQAELTLTIDDGRPEILQFKAGDSKVIEAQSKVLLSTTNAGATRVILNGKNLGSLGRAGENLQNIPFFAESGSINSSK
jgi:cytoskeletal protein RodZ